MTTPQTKYSEKQEIVKQIREDDLKKMPTLRDRILALAPEVPPTKRNLQYVQQPQCKQCSRKFDVNGN